MACKLLFTDSFFPLFESLTSHYELKEIQDRWKELHVEEKTIKIKKKI